MKNKERATLEVFVLRHTNWTKKKKKRDLLFSRGRLSTIPQGFAKRPSTATVFKEPNKPMHLMHRSFQAARITPRTHLKRTFIHGKDLSTVGFACMHARLLCTAETPFLLTSVVSSRPTPMLQTLSLFAPKKKRMKRAEVVKGEASWETMEEEVGLSFILLHKRKGGGYREERFSWNKEDSAKAVFRSSLPKEKRD